MRIPIVGLGVLLAFVSCTAAAGVDPLVWSKPEKPPEFRERLAPGEFQRRSQAVLTELGDLRKLELSPLPDHGVRFLRLRGEGQAQKWELQSGDILTKVDQHDLWGGAIPNRESRRRVTIFHIADGSSQTVSAEAGPLGIYMGSHWRPELAYLRSKKLRHAKWDELVIVGSRSCESDPDLAETAWLKALKAGYRRDELANICGAVIALKQGRSAEAADFAYLAREAEPKQAKFVSPLVLLRVMLVNYKLDDAFELCQRFPQQLAQEPRVFRALADLHRGRPESERFAESPTRLADKRFRDDLLPRCIPLTRDAVNLMPKLRERNGVTVSVPNHGHIPLAFLPPEPARDLELTVKFTPLELNTGNQECHIQVGFIPHREGDADDLTKSEEYQFFGAHGFEGSRVLLEHGAKFNGTLIDSPNYPLTLQRPHEIRIIRVAGQAEAFVDGHRVLYQPVLPDEMHLAALVRPFGIRVRIESIEFSEILERR